MFKKIMSIALAAMMCTAFFGCAGSNQNVPDPTEVPADSKKATYLNEIGTVAPIALYASGNRIRTVSTLSEAYLNADSAFTLNMLRAMQDDWTGVFSPISIQIALEVLANGGDAETAQKLLDILCPGMTKDDVNMNAARLLSIIAKSKGVNMNTAVVVNNAYKLSQAFANKAADYYSAAVGALDFSDPAAATKQINDWIAENTDGLIKNMLEELGSDTAIVIMDALTLNLEWEERFYALREIEEFHGTKGVQTTSMMAVSGSFSYGKFDSGEIVTLPYSGGEIAMAVLLPSKGLSLREGIEALLPEVANCKTAEVVVKMPQMELDSKIDILSIAEKLGIAAAVSGRYSELLSDGDVTITRICQENYISVNETGTVAASSSAIVGTKGAPLLVGENEFICNRPYAMVIYHVATGTVLFVTLVNNI